VTAQHQIHDDDIRMLFIGLLDGVLGLTAPPHPMAAVTQVAAEILGQNPIGLQQ
jgi:hypothetical protein